MGKNPRILIAASGTGGHIFPALAIAEYLSDWQVEWLGVPDRLETTLVGGLYPLHTIAMSGVQERSWRAWGQTAGQFLWGIRQVYALLKQGDFQVILTTGGYIAAPAIMAGWLAGIPVVLHESNAIPGKVTRLLGRWCRAVALGFPEAVPYLAGIPTQVVGTPVRAAFRHSSLAPVDLGIPADEPLILVMGGSQGARGLNRLVLACAPVWLATGAWIVHLTGETDAPAVDSLAPKDPHYLHFPFRNDVAALLSRATFVVSRSGAASLAELKATHTPAILIPYPYAAEDHQYVNAQAFATTGAAEILRETPENQQILCDLGVQWLRDPAQVERRRQLLRGDTRDPGRIMAELLSEVIMDS